MPTYSHSRLSTFEQCRLKYKYRYIDKIKPEIEKTIESLLGSIVHEVLEYLYEEIKKEKIPSMDDILIIYINKWKEGYNEKIVIVKNNLSEKDYFNKGINFLVTYYTRHRPFDDNTLETEKRIDVNLDEEKNYKIIGYVDRISYNIKNKEYEIHDYKTANSLPSKEKIENDRQLALYSIAIKEIFGKEKNVCLVWHYLAHDKKICSRRTNEQLEQLKKEIISLINKIESTKEFPSNKSILCNWCEYKSTCPEWSFEKNKKENQKQLNL